MKNLFIPYELALKAKEAGFNEPCLAEFTILKNEQALHLNNHFWTDEAIAPNVPAPIYQQIIDWFEKKYNIIILLHYYMGVNQFDYWIKAPDNKIATNDLFHLTENADKYVVLNKAIEEAFNLISK